MRFSRLFVPVLCIATVASSQSLVPVAQLPAGAKSVRVRAVGRVEETTWPGGGAHYRHQWPAIYFEGRFRGREVYLAFDDATNAYRVWIDDAHPLEISEPGSRNFIISGLAHSSHRIRVEKITESINQAASFDGLFIHAGERALAPPGPNPREIEFIGDSGMTGYGIRSNARTCSKAEVHRLTDTQQAYPALVARHFDADYQINGISGRGIIRNYEGTTPGYAMTDLYPYVFFDKTVPYRAALDAADRRPFARRE